MTIEIKSYGGAAKLPSSFIELTVSYSGASITADVTDLNGYVDENLIQSFRDIAEKLEEQNKLINEKTKEENQ